MELLGDRVRYHATVKSVEKTGDGVTVAFGQNGSEQKATASQVVIAVPAYEAAEIVRSIPEGLRTTLESVKYGPFPTLGIITDETGPMPYDDVYAITTPDASFERAGRDEGRLGLAAVQPMHERRLLPGHVAAGCEGQRQLHRVGRDRQTDSATGQRAACPREGLPGARRQEPFRGVR